MFGFYAPAFAVGVGFNVLNFIVIATLFFRRRYTMSAFMIRSNELDHGIASYLSMILSENRFPLFGIMLIPA